MTSNAQTLRRDINRVTAKFALYLSLDDPNRHSDPASLISWVSDLSLMGFAIEILPIVGHRLVEHATDFLLDKAVAAKNRLLALIRSEPDQRAAVESAVKSDSESVITALTAALARCDNEELSKALAAGEKAISGLVQAELRFPANKTREYSVAVTHEIRIAINAK